MKAISILLHSIKLVFGNIDAAFRVTLALYVPIALLNIYVQVKMAPLQDIATLQTAMPGAGTWFMVVLAIIVMIVLGLWMAVAWHRFVLLEELPTGFIPPFHGGHILSYLGRGILVALAVIGVGFLAGIVFSLTLGLAGGFIGVALAGILTTVVALIIFYRLCPVLPAAALGEPLGMGDAFAATRGQSGTIVLLAIIGGVAGLILQLPSLLGDNPTSALSLIYAAVVGWFTTVIGISVLTTFYGHFIQDREIE